MHVALKYWLEHFFWGQSSCTWRTIPNKINIVIIKYSPISVILLWSSHSTNCFLCQKNGWAIASVMNIELSRNFSKIRKPIKLDNREKNKRCFYIRRNKYCKKLLLGNVCRQLLQTKPLFISTCILLLQKVFVSNVRRTIFINLQPKKCHV